MEDNSEKKLITSFDKSYSTSIFFKKPDKYREIEKQFTKYQNIITTGSNYSYAPVGFDKNSLSIDISSFNITQQEVYIDKLKIIIDFVCAKYIQC